MRPVISVIRTNTCCWTCWTPQKMQKQNMFIINNLCVIYGLLCIHWVIQSSWRFFPLSLSSHIPHILFSSHFLLFLSLHRKAVMPEDIRQRAAPPSGTESSWMKKGAMCELRVRAYGLSIALFFNATAACFLHSSLFFMLIQAATPCYVMTYLCIHTQESAVQRLKKCLNAYWNIELLWISLPQHQRWKPCGGLEWKR